MVLAKEYRPLAEPDVKMLVATVPKLKRISPNIQASADVWEDYRTQLPERDRRQPVRQDNSNSPEAITPFIVQKRGDVVATSKDGFKCTFSYSAQVWHWEHYALMAVGGGAWLKGVVPTRSCLVFRCLTPACAIHPLYASVSDLNASIVFNRIELAGTFAPGDLVLPMLATTMGDIVDEVNMIFQGGYMLVEDFGKPLLNAMLYANIPRAMKEHMSRSSSEIIV